MRKGDMLRECARGEDRRLHPQGQNRGENGNDDEGH